MSPELPLRDIHLPPEPSWWPPAPGWWLLATALLAAIVIGVVLLRRRLRYRRHRNALLAEVDHIWLKHAGEDDGSAIVSDWSTLLRRACLRYRPALATREGLSWSRALGLEDEGESGHGRLLAEAPYRPAFSRQQVEPLREPVREALRRLIDGERIDIDDASAAFDHGGQHA
ncbi:MAG: DUF4381 domain-containing protein [Lysobacteraceae bacterium]